VPLAAGLAAAHASAGRPAAGRHGVPSDARGPYGDPDVTDDFAWARTALWLATGDDQYRAVVGAFHPGALAGGANSLRTPGWPQDPRLAGRPPQCCYLDEPTSETTNDICIRWNAPLAYVAAYLTLTGAAA
jgi:hypothetical protein